MELAVDTSNDGPSKVRLAILRNEVDDDHLNWIMACADRADRVQFDVIDITRNDWMEMVLDGSYEGLLTQPTGWSTPFKILYDERIGILDRVLAFPMYPSPLEILIYENKKFLSYWLKANGIPHPRTDVFYHRAEALDHIRKTGYPLVGKTSMGGGGSGVRILRSLDEATRYVEDAFSARGASRSIGPRWRRPGFLSRVVRKMRDPAALRVRFEKFRILQGEVQRGLVIFQEYVSHDFEWRVVRVGDSYFAHKKLMNEGMASGSLLKEYGAPPMELLDFVRGITDAHDLFSQAVDLFEGPGGKYLVNEMQCIFGQSDPHQMIVDGVPGRFRFLSGEWEFEPGDFNRYECYQLRLDHFLSILEKRKVTD